MTTTTTITTTTTMTTTTTTTTTMTMMTTNTDSGCSVSPAIDRTLTSMPWALLIFSGFKILCRRPTSQHVLNTQACSKAAGEGGIATTTARR